MVMLTVERFLSLFLSLCFFVHNCFFMSEASVPCTAAGHVISKVDGSCLSTDVVFRSDAGRGETCCDPSRFGVVWLDRCGFGFKNRTILARLNWS